MLPILLTWTALVVPASPSTAAVAAGAVDWFGGPYFSAIAKAKAENKLVFVSFRSDVSPWCEKLAQDTFADAQVGSALENLVCVDVDLSKDEWGNLKDATAASVEKRFAVRVFPSMFFVSPESGIEEVISGYIPPAAFLAELQRVTGGQGTLSDVRAKAAAAPEDIPARLAYARKLRDVGDDAGFDREMAAVRALDPKGESLPLRQMVYDQTREAMVGAFDDEHGLYETGSLTEFLGRERHPELLFAGWSYLADLYARLDKHERSREAHQLAWKHVPEAQIVPYGQTLAQQYWTQREQLTRGEKRFALDVAKRTAEKADELPATDQATVLDTLACCYFMNGKRSQALATVERCIELDPGREAFTMRRELFAVRR